ncbi:MAG: zinc ribbon domain-containing protein [Ruminococcus sp.]|nr:zinc ribbon domain-containing protein [Ruminococcus sp.]
MTYCRKCGAEIDDESVICPKCGVQTEKFGKAKEEVEDKVSGGMVVLSILIPIVGVIIGIVNLAKGKKNSGLVYLIVGIVAWVTGAMIISSLTAAPV